jgi:hypothetical protein
MELGGELFVFFSSIPRLVGSAVLYDGRGNKVERATWDWDCTECTALGHTVN